MKDAKRTLKQKAVHGLSEYLVISLYLFVVFSLFVLYKSVILAEHHIDFALHGFALINALALAKVMLVAQELHLADQFRDAPLIYPTLLKSFVFTIVLACFKIVEEAVIGGIGNVQNSGSISASIDDGVGLFNGGSVTNLAGGSITGLVGTNAAGVALRSRSGRPETDRRGGA